MEKWKIAWACFLGGVAFVTTALLVGMQSLWVALLCSLVVGYLAYEFGEVLRAIPKAWHAATKETRSVARAIWEAAVEAKPFVQLSAIVFISIVAPIVWMKGYVRFIPDNSPYASSLERMFVNICVNAFFTFGAGVMSIAIVGLVTLIGAHANKQYWLAEKPGKESTQLMLMYAELSAKGHKEVTPTFPLVCVWFWYGLVQPVRWMFLAVRLVYQFLKFLFVQIHSTKRVLCAADGTLGGLLSYVWLHGRAQSSGELFGMILAGGALGALFGIMNWEIVSVRFLRVPASR